MPLRVYNTLTRSLEVFEPLEPGFVRMYVCGPTVYDYTHLGHARTYVAFDVIKRYLIYKGYDVFHVQNITDIDDKIINRAREEGVSWKDIVDRYTKDYFECMKALGIRVDASPRVTEHIQDIIEFIQALIDMGYAYVSNGSVYFEVDKFPDYGKLSGRAKSEEWRQELDVVQEKKKPYDFALWKRAKPGEPWWESPWGPGRPGWHIECSVMSSRLLGKQFDIHGGGQDLIFPHHENEIAQSEARWGIKPWVRYWMHTGYLTIRGEKMSKSLGNIIPLREAIKKWKPEVLRMWLISAHYRRPLDFSDEALEHATRRYERLAGAVEELKRILRELDGHEGRVSDYGLETIAEIRKCIKGFEEAMDDDFNTPRALSYVFELASIVYKRISEKPEYTVAAAALRAFKRINVVLGVLDKHLAEAPAVSDAEKLVEQLIDLVVRIRAKHRAAKDWETADWIRSELAKLGVKLFDQRDKTTWRLER